MRRTLLVLIAAALPAAAAPAPAKDPFPNGCVDCHLVIKDKDTRLSVLMAKLTDKVDGKLLEATKAASADASKVKGKHPKTPATALKSIPKGCLTCHKKDSKLAPPFAHLMHAVHFGAGEAGDFVTKAKGNCLSCHKLDAKTGVMSIPSAAEK